MIFAVLLCYLNSSERKAGKIVARKGLEPWGLFLESPETFRAYFGWDNSLCIFETKASQGTKLCRYFYFLLPLQHVKRYALQNKQVVI